MNHSSSLRRLLATAAAGVLLVAAHGTAHAADASTCAQGSRFDARLVALAKVNPSVREEEIAALAEELEALRAALATATPRLDAIRFVCSQDIAAR